MPLSHLVPPEVVKEPKWRRRYWIAKYTTDGNNSYFFDGEQLFNGSPSGIKGKACIVSGRDYDPTPATIGKTVILCTLLSKDTYQEDEQKLIDYGLVPLSRGNHRLKLKKNKDKLKEEDRYLVDRLEIFNPKDAPEEDED